jgi:NAD(P)-dependent dehydrogenase (short-subunit alcohol dehydrogenase family)
MGKLDGKVALITGGARGQGRSHAITFAREGADIVVCDLASQIETVPYAMSNPDDLSETVKLVEEQDRRCVAMQADVRDTAQVKSVVDRASAALEFGQYGITVNAVCPTNVDTAMIQNQAMYSLFAPDIHNPTRDDVIPGFTSLNALPVPWVQVEDISEGMLYLAAESGRYVTGETLTIAAGWNANNAA